MRKLGGDEELRSHDWGQSACNTADVRMPHSCYFATLTDAGVSMSQYSWEVGAHSETGSNIVMTKRGMGGRIAAMLGQVRALLSCPNYDMPVYCLLAFMSRLISACTPT